MRLKSIRPEFVEYIPDAVKDGVLRSPCPTRR